MTECRYVVGDVCAVLAELPDESVDLVLTSPPFLALRSYLPADHPDKAAEIGSEPTPAAFLTTLLTLTAEWGRVLAPHGSICVELGDTYSGSGGAGGDYDPDGLRAGQARYQGSARSSRGTRGHLATFSDDRGNPDGMRDTTFSGANTRTGGGPGWPLAKSLCGIPHLYHLSLAYGRNILTGQPSPAGQWRVRNVVAWCRPNPPVGALGDKFRPATSYLTIATKAGDRYFDLDAVRTPLTEPGAVKRHSTEQRNAKAGWDGNNAEIIQNPAGAPPLDYWEIPTQPYSGSHHATFPAAICERPIKAMCPQRVCEVCGEPSRRISERDEDAMAGTARRVMANSGGRSAKNGRATPQETSGLHVDRTIRRTAGWTDCGHDAWRNGRVLDPFGGSGTTGMVATGLGRDALLIDLDERNVDLARDRVGPMLLAESTPAEAAEWLGAKAMEAAS